MGLVGSWEEAPVRLVDGVELFERAFLRARDEEMERQRVERRRNGDLEEKQRKARSAGKS